MGTARVLVLCTFISASASVAAAQQPQPAAPAQPPAQTQGIQGQTPTFGGIRVGGPVRKAQARRTTTAPTIDGALDDRAWEGAEPLEDFTQAEPYEGNAATERTTVRLLYDDKNLYVAVDLPRRRPSHIVHHRLAARLVADRPGLVPDHLRHLPRPPERLHLRHHSGGTAVRRAGSERGRDAGGAAPVAGAYRRRIGRRPERELGRLVGRADPVIGETGWTAEFRIPLRRCATARLRRLWGVNFSRAIERKRELVYWSPVSRAFYKSRACRRPAS